MKLYRCHKRNKYILKSKSVKRHGNKDKHPGKTANKYQCKQCNKNFFNYHRLKCHQRIHNVNKYQCSQCDNSYSSVKDLVNHMKLYICKCDESFLCIGGLQRHFVKHTLQKTSKYFKYNKFFSKNSSLIHQLRLHFGKKPHQCDKCDRSFAINSNLKEHLKTHSREKVYQCSKCDKCKTLKINLSTHNGVKPYICKKCCKSFSSNINFNKYAEIQMKETQFQCGECENYFSDVENLINHMKPYLCDQCDKAFSCSVGFQSHLVVHTVQGQYKLRTHEKTVLQNNSLKHHTRIHSAEKTYQCNQCNKSFSNGSKLEKHIKTHTDEKEYQCSKCDKCKNLKIHLRKSIGEKPYICNQCRSHFLDNVSPNEHTYIRKRRIQCSQCDQTFLNSSTFIRHMKLHTEQRLYLSDKIEKSIRLGHQKTFASSKKPRKKYCKGNIESEPLHIQTEMVKCPLCESLFRSNILNKHIIDTHTTFSSIRCRQNKQSHKKKMPHLLDRNGKTCQKVNQRIDNRKPENNEAVEANTNKINANSINCQKNGEANTRKPNEVEATRSLIYSDECLDSVNYMFYSSVSGNASSTVGDICCICGLSFKQLRRILKCSLCNYGLCNVKCLQVHLSHNHSKPLPLTDANDYETGSYLCVLCETNFDNMNDLEKHIATHTDPGLENIEQVLCSNILKDDLEDEIQVIEGDPLSNNIKETETIAVDHQISKDVKHFLKQEEFEDEVLVADSVISHEERTVSKEQTSIIVGHDLVNDIMKQEELDFDIQMDVDDIFGSINPIKQEIC